MAFAEDAPIELWLRASDELAMRNGHSALQPLAEVSEGIIAKSLNGISGVDFSGLLWSISDAPRQTRTCKSYRRSGDVQICRFNLIHDRQLRSTKAIPDIG